MINEKPGENRAFFMKNEIFLKAENLVLFCIFLNIFYSFFVCLLIIISAFYAFMTQKSSFKKFLGRGSMQNLLSLFTNRFQVIIVGQPVGHTLWPRADRLQF